MWAASVSGVFCVLQRGQSDISEENKCYERKEVKLSLRPPLWQVRPNPLTNELQ